MPDAHSRRQKRQNSVCSPRPSRPASAGPRARRRMAPPQVLGAGRVLGIHPTAVEWAARRRRSSRTRSPAWRGTVAVLRWRTGASRWRTRTRGATWCASAHRAHGTPAMNRPTATRLLPRRPYPRQQRPATRRRRAIQRRADAYGHDRPEVLAWPQGPGRPYVIGARAVSTDRRPHHKRRASSIRRDGRQRAVRVGSSSPWQRKRRRSCCRAVALVAQAI